MFIPYKQNFGFPYGKVLLPSNKAPRNQSRYAIQLFGLTWTDNTILDTQVTLPVPIRWGRNFGRQLLNIGGTPEG